MVFLPPCFTMNLTGNRCRRGRPIVAPLANRVVRTVVGSLLRHYPLYCIENTGEETSLAALRQSRGERTIALKTLSSALPARNGIANSRRIIYALPILLSSFTTSPRVVSSPLPTTKVTSVSDDRGGRSRSRGRHALRFFLFSNRRNRIILNAFVFFIAN